MVRFRSVSFGSAVENWWAEGEDRIAFSRGDRGFFAVNRSGEPLSATLQTGLPVGRYCDVLDGHPSEGGCTGAEIEVGADGTAEIEVAALRALALHVEARPE